MFDMLEAKTAKSGLRWTIWLGIGVVAGLVGSMVLVQQLWPETLRQVIAIANGPIVAPSLPKSAPPATKPPKARPTKQFQPPGKVFLAPADIPPTLNLEPEPSAEALPTIGVCIDCTVQVGNQIPPGIVLNAPAPEAPPAPPARVAEAPKPAPPQSIRVGGNVQEANLVRRVVPEYPPLAKQARISGTVRFTAIIGKDGSIKQLVLLSGHPLLAQVATASVSQWRYRPTLLNGEPVEVITQIEVNFTLAQ